MRLFLSCLILLLPYFFSGQSAVSYLDKMVESISTIQTLKYDLHSKELIDGQFINSHVIVKFNKQPFRVYTYMIKPEKGVEVLFSEENKFALVKPKGFPFINIRLDPYGKIMRNNQHHTLLDSGFDNVKEIVLSVLGTIRNNPDRYIFDLGNRNVEGREYKVIQLLNPDFSFIEYVVKKGEDIESISKSLNLCSYIILLKNNIDFYDEVYVGDKIFIPNSYAEKVELWIDLKSYLPLIQKVFIDDKLFEYYEFRNLVVNPQFTDNEFNKDYVDYGF